jgi:hypothetical protein
MRSMGLVACAFALVACHAGGGAAPATPGFVMPTVLERAETAPITAVSGHAPSLWAIGAPGLRRWDVSSGAGGYEWELVGDARLAGSRLTALAADEDGNAWIAISGDVGRFAATKKGDWRYEDTGAPGDVSSLAPRAGAKGGGAWAGGSGGLFRYDGHRWLVVDGLDGAAITWLHIDDDGQSVWGIAHALGLFHATDQGAALVPTGQVVTATEIVGLARTVIGTRVLAGNFGAQGRLYILMMDTTIELLAPPGIGVRGLVERGGDAVLIAGPAGAERAYRLQPLAPGEPLPAGALRFSSAAPGEHNRWAAVPIILALPPGVTAATTAGGEIYFGTAERGVAKAAPGRPEYLEGSELVGDADRFSVACLTPDRCLVVTEAGQAWKTDGARYEKTSVGETTSAMVLGVVSDGQGSAYAVSSEPPWRTLTVTRRDATKDAWQPAGRVAIDLPPHTTPVLSFLAISPAGTMWGGLRAASDGGEDVGYGAIELELQTGISVQHHPRRPGVATPVEALPLPADLEDVLFDGAETWFASLSGVSRFQQGQLESWGEGEGLPSELVWGIVKGADGTVVAATSEGLARFDGHAFHSFGGERYAVHGVALDGTGMLWAGTNKGLRPVQTLDARLDAAPEVVDGSLRDLARDAFGRVWAMTANAIALVTPGRGASQLNAGRGP